MPADEPETTPQGPRSPLSPQSPGFAEVFADEADVDGWRLAFASKQRLSVKRDEDVDKEPTYALSCRCGTFKWTIPKLPFARFEALENAIKQPPLKPSLAFPRRTRFLRAPPAETALDAWCDILSQNIRAAALEPPTTDLADALDALSDILRLEEAKPNIDAAGAVLEKPQLQTKTPRRPATNDSLKARDASVDRRLDSVAAKLRALRKGRTGRKPGKRPSRRALASLRVDAPEVTDGSPPPPPPRPSANALSPNNFSERGRAPVLSSSETATLLHIPAAAPAFGDLSAPVHTTPPRPARPALTISETDTLLHVPSTPAMADAIETRGARSHRRGDSLVQFLEQEPAVAEEAAVPASPCRVQEPAAPEERAVSLTPSPSKLMTSVTETLFHRPAAPPLEELPTEALERELHRRRSVSPKPAPRDPPAGLSPSASPRRPAAPAEPVFYDARDTLAAAPRDPPAGLSDESDGYADSMSDDASFIHGDDDLDSNGTLSPIPSRSTTPVFYDAAVDPSTPRSLTPILYESVLDPEATPTHFRPVEPSASARLLDFLASPFQ